MPASGLEKSIVSPTTGVVQKPNDFTIQRSAKARSSKKMQCFPALAEYIYLYQ